MLGRIVGGYDQRVDSEFKKKRERDVGKSIGLLSYTHTQRGREEEKEEDEGGA